jgi:hypothetical protein
MEIKQTASVCLDSALEIDLPRTDWLAAGMKSNQLGAQILNAGILARL